MDNCCYIIGVRVNHRVANAVGLQEVLTKYGCNIKLRVGLHETSEKFCADDGVIMLQVCGEKADLEGMVSALNAMEAADVEPGTEAGEVISTIAIAVSALVTTAVIAVGVLLLSQIRGFLESPVLQPAFDNILPALFGPLAVVYVAKNWKVALTPLVFMITLFICVPSLASSASVLVPVGALLAIGAARILYKKGLV